MTTPNPSKLSRGGLSRGSLLDWMFEDAHFICTEWRTLQAADQAQLK